MHTLEGLNWDTKFLTILSFYAAPNVALSGWTLLKLMS